MNALLTYDRNRPYMQRYKLTVPTTGEVLTAPNEAQVARAYLGAHAPAVLPHVERIVGRNPQLASRAWRAGLIVAAQGLQAGRGRLPLRRPWRQTEWVEELAVVQGSGETANGKGREFYNVVRHPSGAVACNCADHVDGRAPTVGHMRHVCKHILAHFIGQRMGDH